MTEYGELTFTTQKNGNLKGILCYYDSKGDRRQITRTSKKTKIKEAKAELREWAEEMRAKGRTNFGIGTRHNRKTVEQVVIEYLDRQLETGKMERSTYSTQINRLKRHVFPHIGDIQFNEVNKDVLEVWLTKLYKTNLKIGTIHGIYADVAKVYKYWYKQGELTVNPFEFVDTPSKSESKKTFLDPDQMERLLYCLNNDYAVDDPLYVAVELAALAGLRRGEICGLRWFDIDFDRNLLTVSSAIGVADGTYTKGPKNKSSNRTFPMVPQLAEVLMARKKSVEEDYGTIDGGWFVCGKAKTYLSPTHLSRMFKEFVSKNHLLDHYNQEVKLHSLRHNFATLGVKANVDIASLSKMMGHASKAMTLDTYADASPQAMKLASEQLGKGFQGETEFLEIWE